tara:strand:- start:5688 stop:6566 length:879 start_codon:yes stop_codon:yes gene_type:complete
MIQITQETRFQKNGQHNWPNTSWPWVTDQIFKKIHKAHADRFLCCELEHMLNHTLNPLSSEYDDLKAEKLEQKLNDCKGWFAISHQYQKKLEEHEILNKLKSKSFFKKCSGIITLSKDLKSYWLNELPTIPIYHAYHPAPETKFIFNINTFKKDPFFRCLGNWGRKYETYYKLSHNWKTRIASKREILPKIVFEKTFVNTIHFMDLEGASANNGVIESMRRNTPLLINRIPAVVEYLGNQYPFYFSNLDEANYKINNLNLIQDTHVYLKNMDKKIIDIKNFINSIEQIVLHS